MCRTCEAHDHADWPGEKRLEGRERKAEYIRPIYGRNYVAASHLPRTAPTPVVSRGGARACTPATGSTQRRRDTHNRAEARAPLERTGGEGA